VPKEINSSKHRAYKLKRISWRPLGGLLGPAIKDARQSLLALIVAVIASLVTGLGLVEAAELFEENHGLFLILPAAIGLRGNVFGPFASRLSTAIQAGIFSWSWKRDSLLGQNIISVASASFSASLFVGVLAKFIAEVSLGENIEVMSLFEFVLISLISAAIATVFLLAITLALAVASARFGWDLDNVIAPIVSAAGDLVTLPAVLFAVVLLKYSSVSIALGVICVAFTVLSFLLLFHKSNKVALRIYVESLPVLFIAGFVSLLAGIVLESSRSDFQTFSVLLVLLPGYLTTAGALGGILSNRLSTKVHLGLVSATSVPSGAARKDIALTFQLALPIFIFLAFIAQLVVISLGESSPGLGWLIVVLFTGGLLSTTFVALVAYYGTLIVVKFGLDPDNHGIPVVSASLDLVGSSTLVGALMLWGLI